MWKAQDWDKLLNSPGLRKESLFWTVWLGSQLILVCGCLSYWANLSLTEWNRAEKSCAGPGARAGITGQAAGEKSSQETTSAFIWWITRGILVLFYRYLNICVCRALFNLLLTGPLCPALECTKKKKPNQSSRVFPKSRSRNPNPRGEFPRLQSQYVGFLGSFQVCSKPWKGEKKLWLRTQKENPKQHKKRKRWEDDGQLLWKMEFQNYPFPCPPIALCLERERKEKRKQNCDRRESDHVRKRTEFNWHML